MNLLRYVLFVGCFVIAGQLLCMEELSKAHHNIIAQDLVKFYDKMRETTDTPARSLSDQEIQNMYELFETKQYYQALDLFKQEKDQDKKIKWMQLCSERFVNLLYSFGTAYLTLEYCEGIPSITPNQQSLHYLRDDLFKKKLKVLTKYRKTITIAFKNERKKIDILWDLKACAFCLRTNSNLSLSGAQLKRCKGCHKENYCNMTCHKSDWKNHKKTCPWKSASKKDECV